MPHNSGKANKPKTWLDNAHADIVLASIDLPEGATYEQLCFHAQQAAEKSLKALLLHYGIEFPFTHNIGLLVSFLPSEMQASPSLGDSVILTPFAVLTRYPGELEPVTKEKYIEAFQVARSVFEWASAVIEDKITTHDVPDNTNEN